MSIVIEVIRPEKKMLTPPGRWRQVAVITLAALGLYFVVRNLPTGTNLSHMDFRSGAGSIEFCDPSNPQFMPVVSVRSPVGMTLANSIPAVASQPVSLMLTLSTSTGKTISAADLLVVHTQKLHLLIIDPTLTDYQHVHPEPGQRAGEWLFSFTPKRAGLYRVFADFTPIATGRGLYASAELEVSGNAVGEGGGLKAEAGSQRADVSGQRSEVGVRMSEAGSQKPEVRGQGTEVGGLKSEGEGQLAPAALSGLNWTYQEQGYQFALQPSAEPIHAGKSTDLSFTVSRVDGGDVALQPVMGAYAHLVAFDSGRSGFAHLHPNQTDLSQVLDPRKPQLTFKLTIPRAGRYVIWSQVILAGRETFAPFWFEVLP